jgi:tRNA (guanine-N7-)-methyltransferase
MTASEHPEPRRIRSFVRRQGRITQAQNQALETLWPLYGLDPALPFEPSAIFGRDAPLILEIGFGDGESLAEMAAAAPAKDFLGVEVHKPGVGHLLLRARDSGLSNIRVYCADAVDILREKIALASLDGLQVFFPDPWPKKRHRKRRLVNPEFARLAAERLKLGGVLHCATDWAPYAEWMLEVLEACGSLRNLAGASGFAERPGHHRPPTKFEARGARLGHGVWDLLFEKSA